MVFPLDLDKINKLAIISGKILELRVDAWSISDGDVLVRGFTENEQINIRLTTTDNRANVNTTLRITSIPIVLQVENDIFAAQRGDVYVKVRLFLGGVAVYTFLEGYISQEVDLTWPPGIYQDMFSGRGRIRSFSGTNPAANTEISETVPTNTIWRVLGIRITLVTDANVANRRVVLITDDGSDILFEIEVGATQAASITRSYGFAKALGNTQTSFTINDINSVYPAFFLTEGFRIRTSTNNFQVGDNFGAPRLLVEEWIQE